MQETTIFRQAFGNSPVIRVLDFLIEGRGLDYSLTDIAENAGIGWTTLHRIWDNLVRIGIVKHTRNIGKAKLFRLNTENAAVKKLIEVYDTLLAQETRKALKRKVEATH
ncbi:MAG: helix-turn-helix domain-containing protein [Candidatus Woesearchaeota archaeon]